MDAGREYSTDKTTSERLADLAAIALFVVASTVAAAAMLGLFALVLCL